MAPGILAQSVLFVAIFYGIAVIWERDLGVVHKLMVTPTPRSALVLGKALSAGVRGLSQAVIIYALSLVLGVRTDWHPLGVLGVLAMVVLGAALFSTFSLIIATLVRTRERFMGIGQVLTMPLFFASNAIYPISIMPAWLQVISHVNPLSYQVDALRTMMLSGSRSEFGLGVDFTIVTLVTAALVAAAGRLYPGSPPDPPRCLPVGTAARPHAGFACAASGWATPLARKTAGHLLSLPRSWQPSSMRP